jgi:trigger factor
LKIDKQFTEDHQAKLTVELEPQNLEEAKHRAARKIAQKVKIPGFRPGKAPYPVVLRTVGEAAVLDEAMEILVNERYPKIIEESGIQPYGPGSLENIQKLDPPTLEFLVPLDAEVTLSDYHALRFPYELKPITEEEVDQTIEDLQDRMAVLEPVDRPAQEGDQVFIHLSSERKEVNQRSRSASHH